MRILMITYHSIGQHQGGLQVQIFNTKKELETLGHFVKLFDPWTDYIRDYDIIHFFAFMDTSTIGLMQEAKKCGKLVVMSTVYNDILNVKKQKIQILLSKAYPTLSIEKYRQRLMIEYIDLFVFLSAKEEKLFQSIFDLRQKKTVVIKNGVEDSYISASEDKPNGFVEKYGINDFVLHVGQFTKNKNQLALIRAMSDMEISLVMIGDIIEEDYYQECKKHLGKNMLILQPVSSGDQLLADLYKAAKLFILPSFREAYPLTALEAGLSGTKVLMTKNSLFDDDEIDVSFCNPNDEREIHQWIVRNKDGTYKKEISDKQRYSWRYQIMNLETAYRKSLNG